MTVLSARTFIGRAIAPRARCCGLLSSLRLAVWAASDRTWSSSGGVEDEHPLHIPRHGHKAPLATHFFESAQRKLTESEHGFDDAEHRFRGLLAQGIERPALRRLQPMRHRRDRRWIFWRGRRRLESFLQRWMMRLTAHGNQRFDPRLLASLDIRRAEITRVRQQRFGFAQFFGQGADLAEHGLELLLVVWRLNDIDSNHQHASHRHGGLRVITLLKAAAGHRHDARLFVGEIDLIARLRSFGRRRRRLAAWLLARGRNLGLARREFGFMLRQLARVTLLRARQTIAESDLA